MKGNKMEKKECKACDTRKKEDETPLTLNINPTREKAGTGEQIVKDILDMKKKYENKIE